MLIVQKHNIDELKKYGFEEGFITNGRKDKPCLFLRDFMTCDMYILEDEITNVYGFTTLFITYDDANKERYLPDILVDLIKDGIVEKRK